MYKLLDTEIYNFARFSDKPQIVSIPDGDTLILGENNDSTGADSNGSGKSSFVNAITWCICGDVSKDLLKDDVIREGQDTCYVQTRFLNQTTGEVLRILRKHSVKTKQIEVDFTLPNGKVETVKRRTPTQYQEEIFKIFNLDPKKYLTDLINTTHFSSETIKGIASSETSNAERMQFFTRFLSLERLDLASVSCKELKDTNKASLEIVTTKIDEILLNLPEDSESFEVYEKAVIEQIETWNTSKAEWLEYKNSLSEQKQQISALETLRVQLDSLKNQKAQFELNKANYKRLEKSLNEKLEEIDKKTLEYAEFNTDEEYDAAITKIKENLTELSEQLGSQKKSLADLIKQIGKPLTCPVCQASLSFHDDSLHKIDLNNLNKMRETLKVTIEELNKSIQAEETERKRQFDEKTRKLKLNTVIEGYDESITILTEQKDSIVLEEVDFDTAIQKFEEQLNIDIDEENIKQQYEETETQLSTIQEELGRLREINRNINTWKTSLAEYQNDKAPYEKKVSQYLFWQQTFLKIKQIIIDNYLPIFEERINSYLSLANTGFSIRLSLYRETQSKSIKQEFEIIVTDEHGVERKYETYSQGEKRRIATYIGFALRDIAKSRSSLLFDFMFLDEIVENLDVTGVGEFFKVLQTIDGQKLTISHLDHLKNMFSNHLTIVRQNGVSHVRAS